MGEMRGLCGKNTLERTVSHIPKSLKNFRHKNKYIFTFSGLLINININPSKISLKVQFGDMTKKSIESLKMKQVF